MLANLPSRNQLLVWVSDVTKTKVEKLEQLSDAIQFCQIFDKIYPKNINLNKLKRDVKVTLEKEKNFRVLLDAISQLQLSVSINIMDLASGKVTAILELLQWMWKEFQKPSITSEKMEGKDNKEPEVRMIKSYVGKLVTRPNHSLIKENHKSEATKSISSSRRSLGARINSLPKREKSDGKSVKTAILPIEQKSARLQESQEKEKIPIKASSERKGQSQKVCFSEKDNSNEKIDISQAKDLTTVIEQHGTFDKEPQNQGKKSSKSNIRAIKFSSNKEKHDKMVSENRENQKRLFALKKNSNLKREFDLSEILESTLNLEREKLCKKLIKVTEAAVRNNPELESKLKRLLAQDESSKKERPVGGSSSFEQESSLKCERDSFVDVDIDSAPMFKTEQNKRTQVIVEAPKNSIFSTFDRNNIFEKKDTVQKSSIKQKDQPPQNQIVLSSQVIKQISAQKEKAQISFNEEKDQNRPDQRLFSSNLQQPLFTFQNIPITGINFFTEKKNELNGQALGSKKEPQSENLNHHQRQNEKVFVQNQNIQIQKSQKNTDPIQTNNAGQGESKGEGTEYPELQPYSSVNAVPQKSSSNMQFF